MTSAGKGTPNQAAGVGTPPLLWRPTEEQVAQANITRFMRFLADRGYPAMSDHASLYQWSISEVEAFWAAVWDFCGVIASRRYDTIVEDFDRMPGARWFNGARLNFAENLLRYRDDRPALVAVNDRGGRRELSYKQLALAVGQTAGAL